MVWGILIFVAFAAVVGWLVYAANPPPPDDALAMSLAVDLGAERPTLVGDGDARYWRISLPLDSATTVYVANDAAQLRRTPRGFITHAATVLAAPLLGRDQEQYESRTVIPGEDGELFIGGSPSAALEGWELHLDAAIIDRMRDLGLLFVRVEHEAISTGFGRETTFDAASVLEIADFLGHLEARLVQQLH